MVDSQIEGDAERNKVRYVRTLGEGLVREMSYVPKEGGSGKQSDSLAQGGGNKGKGKDREKREKDY